MSKRFRFLVLPLVAVLLLVACLSTNLPPIGTTNGFTPEDDERQLWQALREAEGRVLPSKAVFEDPALEQYLTDIARRVTPASYTAAGGQPVQVKVRKDPRLNAGAMAHGLIVVHTGLVSGETRGKCPEKARSRSGHALVASWSCTGSSHGRRGGRTGSGAPRCAAAGAVRPAGRVHAQAPRREDPHLAQRARGRALSRSPCCSWTSPASRRSA